MWGVQGAEHPSDYAVHVPPQGHIQQNKKNVIFADSIDMKLISRQEDTNLFIGAEVLTLITFRNL